MVMSVTLPYLRQIGIENRKICALGGLLSYIQKNNVINQLEDRNQPLSILAIAQMEFTNTVIVDDTTLRALCIFQSEFHPVGSTSRKRRS
ncbi:hypothetical protein BVRB_035770 [Beta vulgaris subsp. vulgaris]|uniref:Uncharacterized protein n=1 Tax=Beta vulgaris subsp. vulgaris TaxID=3555 RepID=A0A0J8BID9_BETVV|nr:hypothetical protein BVRB_035770 [Beta vulgaris subsp. vulgaris]